MLSPWRQVCEKDVAKDARCRRWMKSCWLLEEGERPKEGSELGMAGRAGL